MSKGSKRRPTLISREEEELNWKLALGYITFETWKRKRRELEKQGLIKQR